MVWCLPSCGDALCRGNLCDGDVSNTSGGVGWVRRGGVLVMVGLGGYGRGPGRGMPSEEKAGLLTT